MCVLVTVHFTVDQFFMFRLNVQGQSNNLICYLLSLYACKVSPAQGVMSLPPHSKCELLYNGTSCVGLERTSNTQTLSYWGCIPLVFDTV